MIRSNLTYLEPELMDIVRLFPEAEELEIFHEFIAAENKNVFRAGDEEYAFQTQPVRVGEEKDYDEKALVKRYAKLALYRILSKLYKKTLPWGALTGIRPTKLAYRERELGQDHLPLLRAMEVSEENVSLLSRVLMTQEGIYEKRAGNCDLYVSLPFCPTRCSYCSFITAPIDLTKKYMREYLNCLKREIEGVKPLIKNLRSVYAGGGTPFVLEAEELEEVFRMIAPLRTNNCEYTVEAGRADVFTTEKLDLCKKYGVTRICINAQSFCDQTLERIGRKHTGRDVELAFEMAKPYGFTVNCDLIAGLVGESAEEFGKSVDRAIALEPENITVHTLCLKKGAKLKEETAALGDEGLEEMISLSREKLTAAGYEPYYLYRQKYMAGAHENVGWTKKGYASVYNIDVMEETADNIAVGANAVTKKVVLQEGRIKRLGSPKDIPTYLNKVDSLIADKNKLFS